MTEYLKKTFTVGMPTGQKYRDNWEEIFGKPKLDPARACRATECHAEAVMWDAGRGFCRAHRPW